MFSKRNPAVETERGRAVLVYYGGITKALGWEVPQGAKRGVTNVKADVCLVGGDGTTESVKGRLSQWASWLMAEGDEIPVRVDPRTGRIAAFDREGIDAQYAPRMSEIDAAAKRQSSLAYQLPLQKGELAGIREAASDIRKLPGLWKRAVTEQASPDALSPLDDETSMPIEGVTFDTWVNVHAAIVREKVAPGDHEVVAQRHGVPAGRWAAIHSAWMDRLKATPALAHRFGAAYQRALAEG